VHSTPPHVLCVDADEDACFILYALLKGEGCDAVTTFTLGDALALAKREAFDLYILDTRYQDGTGLELCRALRGLRPDAKVIFYSGAAHEADRQSVTEAGELAYVKKHEIKELLAAVRRALADKE
jgi:DNA-binding response OmpR family regulator